jgi:hypothetical protein
MLDTGKQIIDILEGPVVHIFESCMAIASLLCADTHTRNTVRIPDTVTYTRHISTRTSCPAAATAAAATADLMLPVTGEASYLEFILGALRAVLLTF